MELQDVLKPFCYDWLKKDGGYVLPAKHLQHENPFFKEEEITNAISEVLNKAKLTEVTKSTQEITPEEKFKQCFREIFFDGVGFYMPAFAHYINVKPEHQVPNDITFLITSNKQVPFYNFDKDVVFNKFMDIVIKNLGNIEEFIKGVQEKLGSSIGELVEYLNTDGKGERIILDKTLNRPNDDLNKLFGRFFKKNIFE